MDNLIDTCFAKLVGQEELKRSLQFYLRGQHATGIVPFLLFNGAKGLGKTEFARCMRDGMPLCDSGAKRPFLELNCSTLRNVESFFEQIYIPLLLDKEAVVLFDECHELPRPLVWRDGYGSEWARRGARRRCSCRRRNSTHRSHSAHARPGAQGGSWRGMR